MAVPAATAWRALLDALYGAPAEALAVSQKTLRALARETGFPEALEAFRPASHGRLRDVLRLCRPVMCRLDPDFSGDWLAALRDYLHDGLFRDASYKKPPRATRRAFWFYLSVLEWFAGQETGHDPLRDVPALTREELAGSRIEAEYRRFSQAVAEAHLLTLMRMEPLFLPIDPGAHTIGVHNIALRTARQAAAAGLPVDVALVSASSLGHDIGKFGCRGEDAGRIPYLHYYFTWQWLTDHGCPAIAHIAANHSTWDLEFENLPLESLILIYADFRVRGTREPAGHDGSLREVVRIYSLQESYQMILSKLDNMTEEKRRRYQTVYSKLRDFERFLTARGVDPDGENLGAPKPKIDAALRTLPQTLDAFCDMTFSNNVALMHTITVDASFEQLLEAARSEKNLYRIRTYLHLFSEYHTYMTGANKRLVLAFLYELLMHPQGDVRRRAGRLMGKILANSGPRYRKELPAGVSQDAAAPTLLAFLAESAELWSHYLEICLHPDHKITAKHAQRISNSIKIIVEHLFASCASNEARHYLQPILRQLQAAESPDDRFVLLDALQHVPTALLTPEELLQCLDCIGAMLPGAELRTQIAALRCMEYLLPAGGDAAAEKVASLLPALDESPETSVRYLLWRLRTDLGQAEMPAPEAPESQLYLSNLKNAVHWSVKNTHIDLLCDNVARHPETAFHTAMHLSNLLSVSEHLPVRTRAGEALVEVTARLSMDQQNEIVVDLLRELETGQEEVSRYIPKYLGTMLCRLPEKEFDEGLDFLAGVVRGANVASARASLLTLGTILSHMALHGRADDPLTAQVFGLLLTGVAHYDNTIHQTALSVLCRDLLGDDSLPLIVRRDYFLRIGKKLLTLLSEPRTGQLSFFTRAAILNHLYRFLVICQVDLGDFPFPAQKPAAFFPGTFDPFSAGHKRIVEEILSLGFEVYLAIDEFSWSKQTLPKLQRRMIASMSTAGLLDVYVFPDDVPVNIAIPEDLKTLRDLFPDRELYLVAGSDVIRNASAYRTDAPGSAADYNHVIFCRDEASHEGQTPISKIIRGKLKLLSLPAYYETVSSTRIREYVDKNLDISMMVDPMVQSYIYANGFYLRAPQFKNVLRLQDLYFQWQREIPAELSGRAGLPTGEVYSVLLKSRDTGALRGWAVGHTVRASELYDALGSLETAEYVRQHTSGRVLLVDAADGGDGQLRRALVNELLARSLLDDHTYALYQRPAGDDPLGEVLPELGFRAVPSSPRVLVVDMRMPMAFIQDVLLRIKAPHRDDDALRAVVQAARPRMRRALANLFPGRLVLSFDAEILNQALLTKVQACNGVLDVPAGVRRLGPYMCVPYGKILSGEIVPNTVTKTLHADKVYHRDLRHFRITEYPGYSPLRSQVRTIKSFRRPVLLVDDLLHKGYRMEMLDPIFKEEQVDIDRIIVGILSGRGKDLMALQGREVECEYFIPNLSYWFTESLLYPFLGGDSTDGQRLREGLLPSMNMILPYVYPAYLHDVAEHDLRVLSMTALESARDILAVLERRHQAVFSAALTLKRLAEAVLRPRIPDKGRHLQYNLGMPASSYLEDDIAALRRICGEEEFS